jgi:hypothetical protein
MEKGKGRKWTLYEELKEKEIELPSSEHRLASIEELSKGQDRRRL